MRHTRSITRRLISLATVLMALPVTAAPPSGSKLGIHLIGDNTAGVRRITAAHPRVIKILGTTRQMLEAAREYKAGTPEGIVVLRIHTGTHYNQSDDPAAKAVDFFKTVLAKPLEELSPADRRLIGYVEGTNELDSTPGWGSVEDSKWNNDFWIALTPLIAKAGFKPCAFCIPVGNPPGKPEEVLARFEPLVPALRVVKRLGGVWSYHAYTPKWSTDLKYQESYSLRYRRFYRLFAEKYPDLKDMPLILTEAGFDSGADPKKSGWQANGSPEQCKNWLIWWDRQIRKDPYVLGSTIFQIGSPSTWPSFDLEPIAGWLANHLRTDGGPTSTTQPDAKR